MTASTQDLCDRWAEAGPKLARELKAGTKTIDQCEQLRLAHFAKWPSNCGPAPIWTPSQATLKHVHALIEAKRLGFKTIVEFLEWSQTHRNEFWALACERLEIRFDQKPKAFVEWNESQFEQKLLAGAKLNIVESCFQAAPESVALIQGNEGGTTTRLSVGELKSRVSALAAQLRSLGLSPGDRVAICMSFTISATTAYLALIWAGLVPVAIADSFSPDEIAIRLKIANVQWAITQGGFVRAGKMMPLQNKLVAAGVPHLIILDPLEALRPSDFDLNQLLSDQSQTMPAFEACADDEVNILFSSGTTGEPKALVWTHSTPIKCATDAYFNQNVEVGDVLHWPTNLGWMMGPWVLFAALINRATLALFDGLSNGEAFASFLKQTQVTMLGTVPSLIKVWRDSKLFEAHSFDDLKVLSSTGECSNPADMIYFSWVTGLKPIIEYCGGTEIGGAYVSSYLSEPNVPSCFGGATLGLNFELVQGEVMIVPPSIGLSNRILNRDHRKSYFEGSPQRNGVTLRRHGDELQQIAPQVFRALGRSDDTMNLGGIKVSSAELERAVATLENLRESAAVAISPEGGGPSQLVYFVVGHWPHDLATIKAHMQQLIRERLNPLFKIFDVVQIDQLPRTASNKVLRRVLRDQYESRGKNR